MGGWRAAALAALALGLIATTGPARFGQVTSERLLNAGSDTADWLMTGRTYGDQRHSPLTQINTGTVARLGLAWWRDFDTERGQEATPVEVDGVLYTTTTWSKVYAFDARNGTLLWSYDPKVDRRRGFWACCDVVNRGVAVWDGKVYAAALDGRLTALDARTGKIVWSIVTVDQAKPYTITGAPRIARGKVIIGNGGSEYGVRGYLSAYDARTGKLSWRFYTTPNPQGKADGAASDAVLERLARPTWGGGVPAAGGGATAWEAITYDPSTNLVLFGTGNGSPWNAVHRSDGKSDNLFVASIVAVNADTGKYAWHYQTTPDDTWDFDATQPIELADLAIDGRLRKVAMQANKNGFFYVLDRTNGQLISARPYVQTTWASGVDLKTGRPIEIPGARYETKPADIRPSPFGGHNWQPMSYDPARKLVFIPSNEFPVIFGDDPGYAYRQGAVNLGVALSGLPDDKAQAAALRAALKGDLVAWDPVKQQALWRAHHPFFWNGGVLTTAGGLAFQGDASGRFTAYEETTGKALWGYDAGNGFVAGASTYAIDGVQYVAVMAGSGGTARLFTDQFTPAGQRKFGRLLVFRLDGKATATPYPPPPPPAFDLTQVSAPGDADKGFGLFHANCVACHSFYAAGDYLPNLRASPIVASAEAFRSVVLDGALGDKGMVSFAKWLTPADAEAIRAYIVREAKTAAAREAAAARPAG